jgi:hypothetical protein
LGRPLQHIGKGRPPQNLEPGNHVGPGAARILLVRDAEVDGDSRGRIRVVERINAAVAVQAVVSGSPPDDVIALPRIFAPALPVSSSLCVEPERFSMLVKVTPVVWTPERLRFRSTPVVSQR